ncbi:MAG: alanine--tRNA ligase [Planctomycetota bacterium]|nr:alanine--tRNA ligase [Planctomycetota bacterium]
MPTPSAAIKTASQIRREFLDFFAEKHGHTFVPSSPVVPHDDPTLLFANAGMNQFKDVFLGHGARDYTRAVNTQKCIRAGGKHNDLEDVGKDDYHHTFFEMLGNWSFGDYFKAEAIAWAWDLLTNVWGLEPDRLHATVFEGSEEEGIEPDIEAEELWKRHLPPERISRWGKKDNFWEMGETGPCGPCSEIHYDFTPDRTGGRLVNAGDPNVIEVWNLVFIQFNRGENGVLTPLPARHVDTGMGFERVVRIIQGKRSNYDIDVWLPIFEAIRERTGARAYEGSLEDPIDIAYRVVADHVRCLTMAINDGAWPSNEGRGYVLRRILRRAVRHAHQTFGVEGPVLCELVPSVVASLDDAFPELKNDPERIARIIRDEEESFLRSLDRGLALFDTMSVIDMAGDYGRHKNWRYQQSAGDIHTYTDQAGQQQTVNLDSTDGPAAFKQLCGRAPQLSAQTAFMLHDTYGFPIDLTRVMAEERGMTVDEAGYEKLMEKAREISRKTHEPVSGITLPADAIAKLRYKQIRPTKDVDKYHARPVTATVEAIWDGRDFDDVIHPGTEAGVILSRTNHYAEAGGQVGDRGTIFGGVFDLGGATGRGYHGREATGDCRFRVEDTQAFGDYILHIGRVIEGKLRVDDRVKVVVDLDRRRPTLANHTGTHLLNHALRAVIGDEVNQRGSLVAPDRLRFDFTCSHAMNAEEVEQAEAHVNEAIDRAMTVHADMVPLETARQIHGLRAVFGEKYPDPVRVVSIGRPVDELVAQPDNPEWYDYSIELCGGTHLFTTDEAQELVITHEQALAAGVRRITALTGPAARAARMAADNLEQRLDQAKDLDDEALTGTFDALVDQFEHMTMSATARHRMTPLVDELRERVKAIRKQAERAARRGAVDQAREIVDEAGEAPIIVARLDDADKDTLLSAMDVIRARRPDSATMLFAPDEEAQKVAIAATVPKSLIDKGLKAGDWVREAAKLCGGSGGGRPDMAQAGGKDLTRLRDAMHHARNFAEKTLSDTG